MAVNQDGRPPNIQGGSQPMHEECQGSGRPIERSLDDAWNRPIMGMCCPDSLR